MEWFLLLACSSLSCRLLPAEKEKGKTGPAGLPFCLF
jgi:hypothetical protein